MHISTMIFTRGLKPFKHLENLSTGLVANFFQNRKVSTIIWGFPKMVVPNNHWFSMGFPTKNDHFGVFKETPIYPSKKTRNFSKVFQLHHPLISSCAKRRGDPSSAATCSMKTKTPPGEKSQHDLTAWNGFE